MYQEEIMSLIENIFPTLSVRVLLFAISHVNITYETPNIA